MNHGFDLSACSVQTGIRRESPRPLALRTADYDGNFDWSQLFYDVYRVKEHIVFQGPPLFNFAEELRKVEPFKSALRWPMGRGRIHHRKKGDDIWIRSQQDRIQFSCALGSFDVSVQPNHADLFAGHRVLLTQSKNNEIRWIIDWLKFHQRLHGATAAMVYDNNSTLYSVAELQSELSAAMPDMLIVALSWPFVFGPQAGPFAAVDGVEPDWDSDYCQDGVLQHARFRFLGKARSVMHNDIDEMVMAESGRSVFEAAETSPTGMVKFEGRWISVATDRAIRQATCRHADFYLDEGPDAELSPPKWCLRPNAIAMRQDWGVHNVFGAKGNANISDEFLFRHLRGVTTSWKYDRWASEAPDPSSLPRDKALIDAFAAAGLERSTTGEASELACA